VCLASVCFCFFFQAEDGIRDFHVTGVQTCALPISISPTTASRSALARSVITASATTISLNFIDEATPSREGRPRGEGRSGAAPGCYAATPPGKAPGPGGRWAGSVVRLETLLEVRQLTRQLVGRLVDAGVNVGPAGLRDHVVVPDDRGDDFRGELALLDLLQDDAELLHPVEELDELVAALLGVVLDSRSQLHSPATHFGPHGSPFRGWGRCQASAVPPLSRGGAARVCSILAVASRSASSASAASISLKPASSRRSPSPF